MTKTKNKIVEKQLEDVISEDNENVKIDLGDVSGNIKIEDGTLIRVKSNTFGELIYVNNKTGETTIWSKCGEIQSITMGDLRAMKANQIAFFENQWIIILGVEDSEYCKAKPGDIYKSLAVTKFYTNLVETSNFEEICKWSTDEIAAKTSLMSDNAKRNLIIALNTYVETGVLDSTSKIKAFENALDCELIK